MTHTAFVLQEFAASKSNCSRQVAINSEQAVSQAELESDLEEQAQAIAPEKFNTIEISFYDHEVYLGNTLIACITHDHDDFATQRWVVTVNDIEIHRANTWAKCYDYITWHHKQGTLPLQHYKPEAISTEDEETAQIAAECEKYEFELCDSGIYSNEVKLGEVGCKNGKWWVSRESFQNNLKIPCNCAVDTVHCLWIIANQTTSETNSSCEQFLDQPFDQLMEEEWEQLKKYKPLQQRTLIAA